MSLVIHRHYPQVVLRCERCSNEYTTYTNIAARSRWCPDCRPIVNAENRDARNERIRQGRHGQGADEAEHREPREFVWCWRDTLIYPAGHWFAASYVREDVKAGYVPADAFRGLA